MTGIFKQFRHYGIVAVKNLFATPLSHITNEF